MRRLIHLLAVLVTLGLGAPALAQEYPALHDVTGVASDDVLNVRSGPGAGHEIVGTLGPYDTGVEVIRLNETGTWGFVNTGEQSGWTSMRFLAARPGGTLPDWPALSCFGTEPFWSLTINQGQSAVMNNMGQQQGYSVGNLVKASGRPWPYALFGQAGLESLSAVITPGYCDDGMSDREFGLTIALILQGNQQAYYSGCCALDGR
ncbi:COG3650 family protein [Tropicibacter oceani]|uniref:SH3 domain-containing protein n=1 Tax=Tropicibacter oceani TaxID=3058420 RepID=A0ABY8QIB5_9RHOB|nr:SH3 domain-containing protein [Tropicibacter oceani]WGW04379.1 SH3 domain-containing protein [Tropicibacter oceani]